MDPLRFRKSCSRTSVRLRFADRNRSRAGAQARLRIGIVLPGEEIQLPWISGGGFLGGGQSKIEPEPIREALAGLRRKTFKVIVHETPDATGFLEMPLDLQRPAFHRRLPLPEQSAVTMDVLAFGIIFCRVIAQKAQVD